MVRAEQSPDDMASVLGEFARTLRADVSVQEVLDHLVARIVEALPVTGAGAASITTGQRTRHVAASDDAALECELLQTTLASPCMAAYDTGEVVASPDLAAETRFPEFTRAALALGVRAVFSVPMLHGSGRVGALDLYRTAPGPLGERELAVAQGLADVASACVLIAGAREEARATAELFRVSSQHDPLTGLPNRELMMQRMDQAGRRAHGTTRLAAVLYADLDDFKRVNDAHGHDVGDQVLVAVADRLQELVRPSDTLARLSGDEFLVLCEDLSASDDVDTLATSIHNAFERPFTLPHAEVHITASVGVAYSGPGEQITPELIRDADSAMYAAKRYRKAVGLDPGERGSDLRGVSALEALTHDFSTALAERSLHLAYQPIVRSDDGRVAGVEALLRWDHPVRGPVPAPQVMAIAEHGGLIAELGDWIVRRSCQDRGEWPQDGSEAPLDLNVNLSAVQLLSPGLTRTFQDALADFAVDPGTLVCEITESILIQDGPRALVVLESLKGLGLRIALDDFGTGYSSLTHLHRFPVDLVKIDRSFVEGITFDDAAAAIVRAVVSLGHELGMEVVAEGAQTRAQAALLHDIGCDFVQGYYFAEPMSASDLGRLLEAHPGATVLPR